MAERNIKSKCQTSKLTREKKHDKVIGEVNWINRAELTVFCQDRRQQLEQYEHERMAIYVRLFTLADDHLLISYSVH